MNKTVIASTFALAIACASWPAHAKDEAAGGDRVAGGAKLTKADAARSAQQDTQRPGSGAASAAYAASGQTIRPQRPTTESKGDTEDKRAAGKGIKIKNNSSSTRSREEDKETAAHGVEKKDIRRGAVIAKPGASSPHSTQPAPSGQGAGGQPEQRPGHDPLKTKHDTVKNSISNIR